MTHPSLTCFDCGKLCHIKFECSILLKKQQEGEKNAKGQNKKKAYIAQEENASNTSSDSSNEEEENICLMGDGEVESVVSSFDFETKIDINYDQLLNAFNEMHEDAKKLSQANNFLKGKLRWHVVKMVICKKKLSKSEK